MTTALLVTIAGHADPNAAVPKRAIVPHGDVLVADDRGRMRVVDGGGHLVRRLGPLPRAPQALALSRDRRHAFASVPVHEQPSRLYDVDLATGARRAIARAISPILSPDRRRLAYVATSRRPNSDIIDRTALVIRDLGTHRRRSIAFAPRVPLGTPPELIVSWSPDGRTIVLFDGSAIRLVDAAAASTVPSQPAVPGPGLAPTFLDTRTLVVLTGCCIGPQQLVAVELASGARMPFARLSSPPETLQRLKPGVLLAVTALNELALVSGGHVRVIAKGIAAATG